MLFNVKPYWEGWLFSAKDAEGGKPLRALIIRRLHILLPKIHNLLELVGGLTMHALPPYGFGSSFLASFLVFFIVLWIIAYVFVILEYRFFRDAYRELARLSGVSDFDNAAKWYWYGALLFIILVGGILILVGDVYALLGYNKLR